MSFYYSLLYFVNLLLAVNKGKHLPNPCIMAGLLHSCLIAFVLLCAASLEPVFAQEKDGSDIRVHKFRPKIAPQSVPPMQTPKSDTYAKFGISANALNQINALLLDKQSRTPAQNKIDSRLLHTVRMLQNMPVADGVPFLETDVELDDSDNLYVNIVADVNDDLMTRLRNAGVKIINSISRYHSILAFIPASQMEDIAGWDGIHFIGPRQENFTNVISEGDYTHEANLARNTFGVTGAGIKIGVLSDGVTNLALSQYLGELGPVTILPGQSGSGDEGTAMLEIIHDIAPSASLYFATGNPDIASFAQNILDLRAVGCDIIVDDLNYFSETPFQDGQNYYSDTNGGLVIQAVNEVVDDGALYFSSSANSGNRDSFTSGTYEYDFVDGGAISWPELGRVHAFNPNLYSNQITEGAGQLITLHWSDPLGSSYNDYDLFVLDPTGNFVVDSSINPQNGSQDPFEAVAGSVNVTGNLIVIIKSSGVARLLHLATNRSKLLYATSGATVGHNAAKKAFSVAATPAYLAQNSGSPWGPYPYSFNYSNVVELFSSDGPRRIFFQADGTPITPGNYSSTGGELLAKPDFTAADGVSVTGVGGFPTPFYGTSAAAPHAAAIAALIKSAKPGISNADVRTTLLNSAIDIMTLGWDRNSGAGIIMAYAALNSLGYSLSGTVHSGSATGPAISGATVSIAAKTATTDVNGAFNISGISSGTYTLTISATGYTTYTNSSYAISADQNGLTFSLTPNLPNLVPYQPSGWSDKIIVTTLSGSTSDSSPLYSTDTLYVNRAVLNDSNVSITTSFNTTLYIDGTARYTWTSASLAAGYYNYLTSGYSIGTLNAGTHTIKIVADSTNSITESNESDNAYTKTVSVLAPGYTLSGTVHSGSVSGPAVSGATVSIAGKTASTDTNGAFSINGIPAGTYTLAITASGFTTYSNPTYVMNANQIGLNFVLTSNVSPNVKILGNLQPYSLLQPAYNDAVNGAVILAQGIIFSESPIMGTSKAVTIRGGYDPTFTTQSGYTTLQGVLTVGQGSLVIDRLIIK